MHVREDACKCLHAVSSALSTMVHFPRAVPFVNRPLFPSFSCWPLLLPSLTHLPYNGFNSPGQARHGQQWPHHMTSISTVGFFCALMNSTGVRSSELLGGCEVWHRLWTEPGAAHLDRQVLLCHPEQTQARSWDWQESQSGERITGKAVKIKMLMRRNSQERHSWWFFFLKKHEILGWVSLNGWF